VQTSEKNFSRKASVQVRDMTGNREGWRNLTTATLSRIDFKNVNQESLTIHFPETRAMDFRLVIENQDSPALQVTGVEAQGNVYELVFLAGDSPADQAANAKYGLYGGDMFKPLQLDTAAIQSLVNQKLESLAASLGDAIKSPDIPTAPPSEFKWADLLNNKPVLFSVIGVLVLALGWGLFKAAQRVDELPKE